METNSISNARLAKVLTSLGDFMEQQGALDVVGGRAALDTGLSELAAGAMPLAAELVTAEGRGRPFCELVFDLNEGPHAARVHGFIENFLRMEVPAELLPWATAAVRAEPPPITNMLSSGLIRAAVHDPNPVFRALARFVVFEVVCVTQRLLLLHERQCVSSSGGSRRDVERLAQAELEALENQPYTAALLDIEDPLRLVQYCGLIGLSRYMDTLRTELRSLQRDAQEHLERRRKITDIAARLPGADAAILLNEAAELFGEERLSATQLSHLNPGHLSGLSPDAVYQRVHRLPQKVTPDSLGKQTRGPTFVDLILSAANGEENRS